jgi:(p)ppGpp synthase/HD superfamily hydrolase
MGVRVMQKFNTLADAIALAKYAHRNQTDKAGLPYIEHPLRVLATVQAQGVSPYVQMAAVLHDVPEDTAFSHDVLLTLGFSEAVVGLTRLLDRGHSEIRWYHEPDVDDPVGKDEYYYHQIKANRDATIVKLADIADNMSGWRLSYLSDDTQKRLKNKYSKALDILNPRPVNHGFINQSYTFDPYTLR